MAEDSNIKIGSENVQAEDAFPDTFGGGIASLTARLSTLEADFYSNTQGSRGAAYGRNTQMSSNYKQGSNGWIIKENGDVEFNSGVFRGALSAASIDIPDATTTASFHVDSSGNAWWGTTTAVGSATAPAYVLNNGDALFNNVQIIGTVSGRSTATIASTINSAGNVITNLINARLDTSAKTILSDFTFSPSDFSGALKTGTITWDSGTGLPTGGTGILINKAGILGVAGGSTTFSILTSTGAAFFKGAIGSGTSITAPSIVGGTLDIGSGSNSFHIDSSGNMWLGAASFNISTNPFAVSMAGVLRAASGTIGGWTINSGSLQSPDGNILLDASNNRISLTAGGTLNITTGGTQRVAMNQNGFIARNIRGYFMEETSAGVFASMSVNASNQLIFDLPTTNQLIFRNSSLQNSLTHSITNGLFSEKNGFQLGSGFLTGGAVNSASAGRRIYNLQSSPITVAAGVESAAQTFTYSSAGVQNFPTATRAVYGQIESTGDTRISIKTWNYGVGSFQWSARNDAGSSQTFTIHWLALGD
jgi:hypothetical protein